MNLRRNPRDIEYPWVRARLSGYSGAQILDVGCVGGPIMDRYEAIGFDFRPGAEHWSGRFYQGDILNGLPFEAQTFDCVVSISTFEHIGLGFYGDSVDRGNAPAWALVEVARVVKPGGVVLLTVPLGVTSVPKKSRYLSERHVRQWFDAAKLTVEEWLVVTGATWAIGTGQSEARQVLLAAGVKSG